MDFRIFTIDFKGLLITNIEIGENDQLLYQVKTNGFLTKSYQLINNNSVGIQLNMSNIFSPNGNRIIQDNKILSEFENPFFGGNIEINSVYGQYFIETSGFIRKSFTISNTNMEIAKISRKKGLFHDQFGIAIHTNEHIDFILTLALYLIIRLRKKEKRKRRG